MGWFGFEGFGSYCGCPVSFLGSPQWCAATARLGRTKPPERGCRHHRRPPGSLTLSLARTILAGVVSGPRVFWVCWSPRHLHNHRPPSALLPSAGLPPFHSIALAWARGWISISFGVWLVPRRPSPLLPCRLKLSLSLSRVAQAESLGVSGMGFGVWSHAGRRRGKQK